MDAREKVTRYIHENVSRTLRVGEPRFDESAQLWHVPVLGDVAGRALVLGTYVVDPNLRFVRNPVKQIMDRLSEHLPAGPVEGGGLERDSEPGEVTLGGEVGAPQPLSEHAEEISPIDPLTGLGTPASFLTRLDQEIERAKRYKVPFVVAFLDVDGLWDVNLAHGPFVADALIAQVGKVIEKAVRGTDFVSHWAGGRFALLLQGSKEEVLVGCERILGAVRAFAPVVNRGDRPLQISAHMGGASCPGSDPEQSATPPDLIKEARGLLMAVKASSDRRTIVS